MAPTYQRLKEEEEERLLSLMSTYQRYKLSANRHKKHWLDCSMEELGFQLLDEVLELLRAAKERDLNVWVEAGDVANMAAMIADKVWSEVHVQGAGGNHMRESDLDR